MKLRQLLVKNKLKQTIQTNFVLKSFSYLSYLPKGLTIKKDKSNKRKMIKPIIRRNSGTVKLERCLTKIMAPIIKVNIGMSISASRVLPSFGEGKNIVAK